MYQYCSISITKACHAMTAMLAQTKLHKFVPAKNSLHFTFTIPCLDFHLSDPTSNTAATTTAATTTSTATTSSATTATTIAI